VWRTGSIRNIPNIVVNSFDDPDIDEGAAFEEVDLHSAKGDNARHDAVLRPSKGVYMFIAEFGSGQAFWSILWFFLFFIWLYMVIAIWSDIIRSRDLSGLGKAMWAAAIIFLPYLGFFLYLIARGGGMAERAMDRMQAQDDASRAYIRDTAGISSADEVTRLAALHADGVLSDAEYAQAKTKALGG
jgi:hypothetical protein